MKPDASYVTSLLQQRQQQLEGLHRRINEIELLRYGEDSIRLPADQKRTGMEVRVGLTDDLIESVKAAMIANKPKAKVKEMRRGDSAQENSSKRENFWNRFLERMNRPVPTLNRFADSQVGLGLGYLKAVYSPWPIRDRERRKYTNEDGSEREETEKEYVERLIAQKRVWGPPYATVTPHAMTVYPGIGEGNRVDEVIEHSWRPKVHVFGKYGLTSEGEIADSTRRESLKGKELDGPMVSAIEEARARAMTSTPGQPEEVIKPLAYGSDTSTMVLVTEYWNAECYQVYVNRQLVYEESPPRVAYFMAVGRSTSSNDPDKMGISVAENLRTNEPIINRTMTALMDAVDLQVRKRLTLEVPDGVPDMTEIGADNNPRPKTYTFEPNKATALPSGSKVVDPFAGSEDAYGVMPAIQLLFDIARQHGVAPIVKGMPPGANSSGYRDNSLYLMAKAQFEYIIESFASALTEMIRWLEQQLIADEQTWYLDDLELSPSDVEDWPAVIEVTLDPALPQNLIAEGQFYMDAHKEGYGDRRWVYENGFKEEQSDELEKRRLLEMAQDMLIPLVIQDVVNDVIANKPASPETAPPSSGLVGPDGQPISSGQNPLNPGIPPGPSGAQQLLAAGTARQGVTREPPFNPGTMPPN